MKPVNLTISFKKLFVYCLITLLLVLGKDAQKFLFIVLILINFVAPLHFLILVLVVSIIQFMLNPFFVSVEDSTISVLRIMLFVVTFFRTLNASVRRKSNVINKYIVSFYIIVVLLSILSSYQYSVSVLKVSQFLFACFGIVNVFIMSKLSRQELFNWYYNFIIFLSLFSLPTLFIDEIGYNRRSIGFQGITNQPQALALFLSPAVALLLGQSLLKKISLFQLCILVISVIELYFTKGRTGFISIIIGFIFLSLIKHRYNKNIVTEFLKKPVVYVFVVICVVSASYNQDMMWGYITKSAEHSEVSINQAFFHSRGALIVKQNQNIKENLLTGIGFGLPSWPEDLTINYDPVFNLPLSVPIEKGVFFTSIFEEIGVIGSLSFFVLLFALVRYSLRNSTPDITWMMLTAIATNIGEATLFSFGGMGLYIWMIIGLGLVKKDVTNGIN